MELVCLSFLFRFTWCVRAFLCARVRACVRVQCLFETGDKEGFLNVHAGQCFLFSPIIKWPMVNKYVCVNKINTKVLR